MITIFMNPMKTFDIGKVIVSRHRKTCYKSIFLTVYRTTIMQYLTYNTRYKISMANNNSRFQTREKFR